MQFKFDPNQEFRLKAIEAVCNLFDGQTRAQSAVRFKEGTLFLAAMANRLDLGEAELLENLRNVRRRNGIRPEEYTQNELNRVSQYCSARKLQDEPVIARSPV